MRYIDKETRAVIHEYAVLPWMKLEDGRRHARLINLRTGDFIPLAGSSSDHRATKNAKAAARRLAETGCGFISAKIGRGGPLAGGNPRRGCLTRARARGLRKIRKD